MSFLLSAVSHPKQLNVNYLCENTIVSFIWLLIIYSQLWQYSFSLGHTFVSQACPPWDPA